MPSKDSGNIYDIVIKYDFVKAISTCSAIILKKQSICKSKFHAGGSKPGSGS